MHFTKVGVILLCALASSAGADQEFFCDAVNGNDAWDGTSATFVSGTKGPKKTIGAAVGLADGTATTITALPGVYDEGEYYADGHTNRLVISQRNLVIRSTQGKEKTFISGRHAATANGLGADAIRCVYVETNNFPNVSKADQLSTNVVIRGFTICNGGTKDTSARTGMGAGVYAPGPDAGGAALLVDCTVSNCFGYSHGAVSRANAYRTLFVGNACIGGSGAVMGFGAMASCVVAFNRGSSATYCMRGIYNCTLAFNEGDVCCGGYGVSVCNSLAFGNGNNAGAGGNGHVYLKSSVTAAPSSLHASNGKIYDPSVTITNAALWQCLSPATGDWRLIAGSPAIGRGDGSHLANFLLPPGETLTDFLGTPMTASGAVDCGAVQAPAVTPAGGRLAFPSSFSSANRMQIADKPAFAWRGAYHYGTAWPATCPVRFLPGDAAHPLHQFYWYDGAKMIGRRPAYDGYLKVVPPADDEEMQIQAQTADNVYYANRQTGDDAWDGTCAVHVADTLHGPKRTLQAACDLAASKKVTFIHVAPGVYDEGACEKSESGYFSTNRVYLTQTVTLFATEGPGTAVIKGAPDPATADGLGTGAIRCLWVNSGESFIQGIDLCDGYTTDTADSASRGGATYMGNGATSMLCDCTVSNCHARESACLFWGKAERVRFADCWSKYADLFRYGELYACEVAGMTVANAHPSSGYQGILGSSTLAYGCTFDAPTDGTYLVTTYSSLYFYGCLVQSGNAYPLTGNGGRDNVAAADAGFVDATARDYRLHALSPAIGRAGGTAYLASNTIYAVAGTPRLRLMGDRAGNALRFADGAFDAGANQTTPAAAYALTLEGAAAENATVTGGAWGTNRVTAAGEVTVTAKTGMRPLIGIEVNGVMQPAGTTSYTFGISPTMTTAPVVRVLYGKTWYVDGEHGSDANGGGTLDSAFAHIRAATTNAVSGDVVLVAPGVYGEGEGVQFHAKALEGSTAVTIGSRVVVPTGVTVKSLEGAEKTFIVGASGSGTYGLGEGAVRCVKLGSDKSSVLSGFTLTGGHTLSGGTGHDDYSAGAALGHGVVSDCIISNNAASQCGAVFKLTAVRCRIVENLAATRASVGREAGFHGCFIDRNRGGQQAIQYHNDCYNTTIGPDNRNLSGGTCTAVVNVNSGGRMYNCVLDCYIGDYGTEEVRFFSACSTARCAT